MEIASAVIFYSTKRKEKTQNRRNSPKSERKKSQYSNQHGQKKGTARKAVPDHRFSYPTTGRKPSSVWVQVPPNADRT